MAAIHSLRNRSGFDRDNIIAVSMALIATCAAAATFNATSSEFTAFACGRTLDQAEHFELGRREAYVDRYYEHGRWKVDNDVHKTLAYGAVRPTALNDVDAQLEFSTVRLDKQIEKFADPYLEPGAGFTEALTKRAERDIRDLGIRNHCADSGSLRAADRPAGAHDADYLQPLRDEVTAFHDRVTGYNQAALFLLVALAVFALTDIVPGPLDASADPAGPAAPTVPPDTPVPAPKTDRWRGVRVWADSFCALIAVAAFVYALGWVDFGLWRPFALCVACILGLIVVLSIPLVRRLLALNDPPKNGDHDRQVEGPSDHITKIRHRAHVSGWFKGILLFLIACTAVAAAYSEYRHGKDSTFSDAAGERAVSEQLTLLHAAPPDELSAFDSIRRMALAREGRMRASTFTVMRHNAGPGADTVWTREAGRSATTITHLLKASQRIGEAFPGSRLGDLLDGSDGPYQDSSFPRRFFVHGTVFESAMTLARWDARDAERAAYEQRASVAIGTITLFGIALYLFGQALGMGRSQGGWVLAAFGFGVFFFACVNPLSGKGVVISTDTIDPAAAEFICRSDPAHGDPKIDPAWQATRADAAAVCYALAQVRGRLARKPEDYTDALKLFEKATRQRVGFALADFGIARITSTLWTPQRNTLHVSLVDIDKLNALQKQDHRLQSDLALRRLNAPTTLTENIELHDYLHALIQPSQTELESTIAGAEQKIASETDLGARALLRYRAAVALLADRRRTDARLMYDAAFDDVVRSSTTVDLSGMADKDALEAERRREDIAGAAISDLELLRARCTTLVWLKPDCNDLTVGNGTIDHWKSEIVCRTWPSRCKPPRHAPPRDFSVAWTVGGVAWRIPFASRAALLPLQTVMLVYRRDRRLHTWYVVPELSYPVRDIEVENIPKDRPRWTRLVRSLHEGSGYNDCLQLDSEYRVEVYAHGILSGHAEFRTSSAPQRTNFEAAALRAPGMGMCYPGGWTYEANPDGPLEAGYVNNDRSQGAYGFAFIGHRGTSHAASTAEKIAAVGRAVRTSLANIDRHTSLRVDRKTQGHCFKYFDDQVVYDEFVAGPFSLRAKVWNGDGGLISVGIVWDRTGSPWSNDLSCSVLASMTKLDSAGPEELENRILAALVP
jgi:hypothetical protein